MADYLTEAQTHFPVVSVEGVFEDAVRFDKTSELIRDPGQIVGEFSLGTQTFLRGLQGLFQSGEFPTDSPSVRSFSSAPKGIAHFPLISRSLVHAR